MEKEQIHLIGNLLDLLEVGGSDSVLGMVDVIKLAQLTVSYFFWSLYEKSKSMDNSSYLPALVVFANRKCFVLFYQIPFNATQP